MREYTSSSPNANTSSLFDSERFAGVDDLEGFRGRFFFATLQLSLVLLRLTDIVPPISDVPTLLLECSARKSMCCTDARRSSV
jgi:hypothetical protein